MKFLDKIQFLKSRVRLDIHTKADIRARLSHIIEEGAAVRDRELVRHISQRSFIHQLFYTPMPVFAVIAIIALLGGGTSFAAQGALPGDTLYPIKVNVNEKI